MLPLQRSVREALLASVASAAIAAFSGTAQASLVLTNAGVAGGFVLNTASSGYTDSNHGLGVGPISVGFTSGGGTVVSYYNDNSLVFYPTDANNQTVSANGTVIKNYPYVTGIVTSGGNIYLANQGAGSITKLNGDGSFNSTLVTGLGAPIGMAANPNTGNLYVSNLAGTIFEVNPTTRKATPFITGVNADGLSVSPDGSVLYAEIDTDRHIRGYNTATGQQVFDSGVIPLADGAAAATGALTGKLFVNTNDGNVYEVDEKTLARTLIATGGSRGDLVTVDPIDGSLLLSQSNSIDRLTLPAGSSFTDILPTSSSVAVPEPRALGVSALAMALLWMVRARPRRTRRVKAASTG